MATDFRAAMEKAGIPYAERGVTAVDSYFGRTMSDPVKFIDVDIDLAGLAKVFDRVDYPGLPYADMSIGKSEIGFEARLSCLEQGVRKQGATAFGDFRFSPREGRYHDPRDCYKNLRSGIFEPSSGRDEDELFENAVLISRFPGSASGSGSRFLLPRGLSKLWQKDLISLVLQGPGSADSLEFLRESGFIQAYWPLLAELQTVDHAKDCHPEGGGWSHTLEALGHRKQLDLTLSLAILLHDVGKPRSEAAEGRKFDKHAEIGAVLAARFLADLGFEPRLVEDVRFLIRWHMLPAALPSIPPSRVEDLVADPRFPTLLELFRCDEFSSFKGPDVYYKACAAYRIMMKRMRNPYRDSSGKKLIYQSMQS
ncbi:MAG TPA: HD domain-containing protein [Rectinemataceae bacterium]